MLWSKVFHGSEWVRVPDIDLGVAEGGVWPPRFCGWEPHMASPSALRGRGTLGLVLVLCVWQKGTLSEYLMCARSYSVLYLHMLKFT